MKCQSALIDYGQSIINANNYYNTAALEFYVWEHIELKADLKHAEVAYGVHLLLVIGCLLNPTDS